MPTNEKTQILPLDIKSIIRLAQPSCDDFIPIKTEIIQNDPHRIELHVDISHFNSDTLQINSTDNGILLEGEMDWEFHMSDNSCVSLKRDIHHEIPFPGEGIGEIYSEIRDDVCVIYLGCVN